jgi:CheY-like chemotaxis protein
MASKQPNIDLSKLSNRSLLVIDDNHSLHRDYAAVLQPDHRNEEEEKLDELESLLLGDTETRPRPCERNFEILSAYQGEEAYQLVKRHLAKGIKHPLAFVDMRMPPGWDGLETIKRISEVDPAMRFIIVTAYSDHSEEEIEKELGLRTPITIIHKPFDPNDLYELTHDIVSDWNSQYA